MRKLVIFGAKNFADMAHFFFGSDSGYEVVAFTVDGAYMAEGMCHGIPVVAFEELARSFPPEDADVFVAVGITRINELRATKVAEVLAKGYRLASFVSTRAYVPPDFVLRPNTMIMDQVNIHPYVQIGTNTIVWSNSRIALRAEIGSHCWITSAILGESVTMGDYTFVGLNATVAPAVQIGKSNVIGASALVLHNTRDYAVLKGQESKPSRVPSTRLRNLALLR